MSVKKAAVRISGIHFVEVIGVEQRRFACLQRVFHPLKLSYSRGEYIHVEGTPEQVQIFQDKWAILMAFLREKGSVSDVVFANFVDGLCPLSPQEKTKRLFFLGNGKEIAVGNPSQQKIVEALPENGVIFAVGPAGTGKTYIAIALAVRALLRGEIKKIVLSRPVVEAGESLGFLPGDFKDKINPYLIPLFDALGDMMDAAKLNYYLQHGIIEIAPLAYMRGRTLDNAYILLDEAQNATDTQLKMFLTRLGNHAKALVMGDVTQGDLPANVQGGLARAVNLLCGIEGIVCITFTEADVRRHPLVKKILRAYDNAPR